MGPAARVEASPWGQRVILALVGVLLAAQLGTHLPASPVQRAVRPAADQAVRVLGSEQSWGVFSPNPRRISIGLEGVVTFADGSTETWEVPGGPIVGANLRYYRWRKWLERIRADNARGLWAPTASWIASLHDDAPSPVVRVELVRYFRDNRVAGPQPSWQQATFFVLDVPGSEDRP